MDQATKIKLRRIGGVWHEESCEGDETVVAVPPVAAIVEIHVALLGVAIEDDDVAVAPRIAPVEPIVQMGSVQHAIYFTAR